MRAQWAGRRPEVTVRLPAGASDEDVERARASEQAGLPDGVDVAVRRYGRPRRFRPWRHNP